MSCYEDEDRNLTQQGVIGGKHLKTKEQRRITMICLAFLWIQVYKKSKKHTENYRRYIIQILLARRSFSSFALFVNYSNLLQHSILSLPHISFLLCLVISGSRVHPSA